MPNNKHTSYTFRDRVRERQDGVAVSGRPLGHGGATMGGFWQRFGDGEAVVCS
ncbi:hypothetical protein Hanom_Chr03g00251921 [Helianthus anomalus]